ncbi:antibiotic ABC transporter ATP-binding protein [Lewinellaceae bacterium SD302]|nr:antibiotic ABC transporter ATP-binding protein [Lewinellaceae bacterium SD302]
MTNFRRLLAYLSRYRGLVSLAIISNILTAVFTVISIPLLKPFLDILFKSEAELNAAATEDNEEIALESAENLELFLSNQITDWVLEFGRETILGYVCLAILAAFLLKNLFRYLALFFMAPVRNGVIRDLRMGLYDKLLSLPLAYFNESRKGDLMARLTSDVQEVESSILNVLEAIFREPFIIIGALAFMIYVSPTLTGFVFLLIIFTGVVIGGIGKRLKRASGEVQEKLGDIVSRTEESLGGLRIIKSFGAEEYTRSSFGRLNNDYKNLLTRLLWRRDLSSPLTEFLGIATVALLLWYGSRQVFSGDLEAGTFIAFIFAFYNVIDPAKNFSKAWYNVQKGLGGLERIHYVMDLQNEIVEVENPLPLKEVGSGVAIKVARFSYQQETNGSAPSPTSEERASNNEVLKGISFQIPKGKVVALVGASGAGKSTIADLLPRFYDLTGGSIEIDGKDIRQVSLRDLRDRMGIVSQEAILFNDTIYNNIVFGQKNVTPQQVEEAARVANAHDFISSFPNGYQTNIGDRGGKLSGGQRQRVTIARAILRDPDILILDEATSALDSESEKLVQQALQKLMENRTALVIAHRLSTIQHADEIIVLNEGHIIERGRHAELLAKDGAYRKLVELQGL